MMKLVQLMTYRIGEQTITFTGREPFIIEDAAFAQALLALGVFERLDDGSLRYSGRLTVPLADGSTREVDPRGFMACDKKDLAPGADAAFR